MYAISASRAPRTSAPFSEGTSAGRYVFVSAQPPVDPKTGALVKGSLKEMATQCLDNVEAVLSELDLTLSDVTKVTVLLAGTDDFSAVDPGPCPPVLACKWFPSPRALPSQSRL